MRKLDLNHLELIEGGQNCRGIYESCLTAAALAGAVGVMATAGWGTVLAVLATEAAMEYCRQQYIGCEQTAGG